MCEPLDVTCRAQLERLAAYLECETGIHVEPVSLGDEAALTVRVKAVDGKVLRITPWMAQQQEILAVLAALTADTAHAIRATQEAKTDG
jgi:ABC-type phosphate/phosphonate transport system substrate-binding protein